MNEAGFEAFVVRNYDSVRRALSVAFGSSAVAEELAQEAFARAWRRWPAVSAMERPVAWVYVVAVNHGRRELRREERRPAAWGASPPADLAGTVITAVSVREALDRLTARQRAGVVLRYLADLRVSEVAEAMGCAEGTVKSTLHTALRRLRVEFAEDGTAS